MAEIFEFINDFLFMPIPVPISFNTHLYINYFGIIICLFMFSIIVYIIERLSK